MFVRMSHVRTMLINGLYESKSRFSLNGASMKFSNMPIRMSSYLNLQVEMSRRSSTFKMKFVLLPSISK